MIRQATRDDVIPLFNPIVTKDGRTIEEVPVAKGTIVEVSVIGYNTWAPSDLSLAFAKKNYIGTKLYGARMPMTSTQSGG